MPRQISVVVPCYEEAPNITPLCTRLFKAMEAAEIEMHLILVDDYSGKGSEDTKKHVDDYVKANKAHQSSIELIIRLPEEGKGLSSAVLLGLRKATSDVLVVMDADLQHEPESVPALVTPLLDPSSGTAFVFGSRNVGGGEYDNMPFFRRVVSFGATLLASGLTSQSDPMSGFFALKRSVLNKAEQNGVNPLGYKVGLELLVRSKIPASSVKDVPITFRDRTAGESKLSAKQYILYVLHLIRLYWFLYPVAIIFLVLVLNAVLVLLVQYVLFLMN